RAILESQKSNSAKGVIFMRTISLPRMDSIANAAKATNISKPFLKELIKSGKVVCVMAGNKHLVNLNSLADYLNGGIGKEQDNDNATDG
ncbi:MAG: helix-turn-helix domain-containing protein, partial [Ruminococcus sp.]|nr:helix-turn-helix domain-containing protein [Ruminococcus sp.]